MLLVCLFPLWPYSIKIVIFYLSLYALIFIGIFAIIRFIIYYICRLIGYEFWILPEIFDNDSFKPYYTFKKVEESKLSLIVRSLFIVATIMYIGFLYMFPQSYEGIGDILISSYDDVVEWGREKIIFDLTKDISDKSLPYNKILESDEDELLESLRHVEETISSKTNK